MTEGFQFADIIVLALIAGFILYKLRGQMGRTDGDMQNPSVERTRTIEEGRIIHLPPRQIPNKDEENRRDVLLMKTINDAEIIAGLTNMKAADPHFSASAFLDGAKIAFEMVFDSYVKGDVDTLGKLLAPDVLDGFRTQMDAAKLKGMKREATLVAILSAEITHAALDKSRAEITVRFKSEQIHLTRDAEGKVVEGDPGRIESVEDVWSFERDLSLPNPNWTVVAT